MSSNPDLKFIAISNTLSGIQVADQSLKIQGSNYPEILVGGSAKNNGLTQIDLDQISQLLRMSWQFEASISVTRHFAEAEILRYSLSSIPMQVYYSIFNSLRAFSIASGQMTDTHVKIRNLFQSSIAPKTVGVLSTSVTRNSNSVGEISWNKEKVTPAKFNPATFSQDPWDYVFAALSIAHKSHLDKSCEDWKKTTKERKPNGQRYAILPKGKRAEISLSLRPITILDFLYKLRTSSNYHSVDEFNNEVNNAYVLAYFNGITYLLEQILYLSESLVSIKIGPEKLVEMHQRWIPRIGNSEILAKQSIYRFKQRDRL